MFANLKNHLTCLSLALFCTLLLSACTSPAQAPTVTPTAIPTPSPTKTYTPIPTGTPTPSPTQLPPTSTPTHTTTPEPPPPRTECLDVLPEIPPNLVSSGILVIEGHVTQEDGEVSFETLYVDMGDQSKTQITQPNESIWGKVSPDRTLIAFARALFDDRKLVEENLVIATADGQEQLVLPWEPEWDGLITWLDNQRLVFRLYVEPTPNGNPDWSPLMVLNPFTNERIILTPELPDIYPFHPLITWLGWGVSVYDPTLTRVVYLQYDPLSYTLWDIDNQQILASFPIIGDLHVRPYWSPDGEYFVFAPGLRTEKVQEVWPNYEIYSVTRDGEIDQLTNLTSYYPWVYISDLSLSPDSRYIAFWFSTWMEEPPGWYDYKETQLAVLDTSTGEVTNYCIQGDYNTSPRGRRIIPAPLWSPESKQLVIENRFAEGRNRLILVDLEQEVAVEIAEEMETMGWMVNPPEE